MTVVTVARCPPNKRHQRPPFGYPIPKAPSWPIPHFKTYKPPPDIKGNCEKVGAWCVPYISHWLENLLHPADDVNKLRTAVQHAFVEVGNLVSADTHDLFETLVPFVTGTIDWMECIGNTCQDNFGVIGTELNTLNTVINVLTTNLQACIDTTDKNLIADIKRYSAHAQQQATKDAIAWFKSHAKDYVPPPPAPGTISQRTFDHMANVWWAGIKKPSPVSQKTFNIMANKWFAGGPGNTHSKLFQQTFDNLAHTWFVPIMTGTINPLQTGLGFLKKLFPSFTKAAADDLGKLLSLLKKILPWLEYLAKLSPSSFEAHIAATFDNLFAKLFAKAKLKKLPL